MKKRRMHGDTVRFALEMRHAFSLFGSSDALVSEDLLSNGPAVDAQSLRGDWVNVGSDLRIAMRKLDELQVQ